MKWGITLALTLSFFLSAAHADQRQALRKLRQAQQELDQIVRDSNQLYVLLEEIEEELIKGEKKFGPYSHSIRVSHIVNIDCKEGSSKKPVQEAIESTKRNARALCLAELSLYECSVPPLLEFTPGDPAIRDEFLTCKVKATVHPKVR